MPVAELVDFAAELERLQNELNKVLKDKAFFEGKLNNPNFVSKAPENVVQAQRDSLAKVLEKEELLNKSIADIKSKAN